MSKQNFVLLSRAFIVQLALLTLIWYLLVGETLASWVIGVPAIILSLIVAHHLPALPEFHFKFAKLFPFIFYFFQQSVVGGLDVARRAVHPRCPLATAFIKYKINISNEFARVFFTNSISLLPGTLSVHLRDEEILVHVLDSTHPNQENLYALEQKIAAMFGEVI